MSKSTTSRPVRHFSPHAALAALGVQLRRLQLFGPIEEGVKIEQKVIKDTPLQKLHDAFITILAGAHGLVEINTRLRSDPGLQAAIGRTRCAEQSVVQDTLDACTAENVQQMEQAVSTIYRQQSPAYRHDYRAAWQVLDVDISGMPCGKKAACATKGYFAKQRNRRGRQLGRVLASEYGDIVVDRLFPGTVQLAAAFQPLVLAAEETLELDAARRTRTIVRMDAGGGTVADVNWALERGYAVHCKDYSATRAETVAASVSAWIDDPKVPGRQVGWVTLPASAYVRPVRRLAVRCLKKNGQWGVGVLVSVLTPADVIALTGHPCDRVTDPTAVLLAYVYFYDQRGGGVETSFKEDKQGLGLTKRSKKRFAAQQMVVCLGTLAHNVLVWARRWLAPAVPQLARYGLVRLVRDIWGISGFVVHDPRTGTVLRLVLNRAAPLAPALAAALHLLLAPDHVAVSSGQT
jgi:Transposase DDE domain group 1